MKNPVFKGRPIGVADGIGLGTDPDLGPRRACGEWSEFRLLVDTGEQLTQEQLIAASAADAGNQVLRIMMFPRREEGKDTVSGEEQDRLCRGGDRGGRRGEQRASGWTSLRKGVLVERVARQANKG